jgi:hypothetical protein
VNSDPNEIVAIRHPSAPGFVKTVTRRAFASREARGWVEAKSPKAKALVENQSPEGTPPTPHEEDRK